MEITKTTAGVAFAFLVAFAIRLLDLVFSSPLTF